MSTFYKTAFTLIELLVVIAIIGILSGLIVVSMNGIIDKANITKAQVFSNSLRNSILLGLISEWKLEGDANDSWGNNSGSLVGGIATLTSGCVRDNCLNFDGTDDYLNVGSNSSLNFKDDYTIEMFVYNEASSNPYPTLFNRAGQAGANGYFWAYTSGTDGQVINYQYANGTTHTTSFSNVLPKNQWVHLVFTFTNSDKSLKLYVNGKYINTRTLTGALPVDDGILYFGVYTANIPNYCFKGRMDEIRWYHATMPAYMIKEHYYSALNRLFASGDVSAKEYSDFIFQSNNIYGKY